MASVFEKFLGKSEAQQEREASPALLAISQRRQPTYDEIKETERLNREAGVNYPRFQGVVKEGQFIRNIGGISYVVDANRGAVAPSNQEAPTPRGMNMFEEALSLDPPSRPSSVGMPVQQQQQPPARLEEFNEGIFTMPPAVQPPTIDTTIDDLMSQLQGYGRPPTMPDFDKPAQRDLGLPSFTTPGFAPPGLMTPQQPNIPNGGQLPPLTPDMFGGQLPMPDATRYLPQPTMQDTGNEYLQQPTEEEMNLIYKRYLDGGQRGY